MRRYIRNPFFLFILLLVIAETTAWSVLPYAREPQAATVYRNPMNRHGWPEYSRAPVLPDKDKSLVAFISTSQSVGVAIKDPGNIYFAHIKNAIIKEELPYTIENWSAGAIIRGDIELLSRRAAQRKADVVVFGVFFKNFDSGQENIKLSYSATEIPLLAGDPGMWAYLPGTTLYSQLKVEDVLRNTLFNKSILARSRGWVRSSFAGVVSAKYHPAVFGRKIKRLNMIDQFAEEKQKDGNEWKTRFIKHIKRKGEKLNEFADRQEMLRRVETFRDFHMSTNNFFSKKNIRSLWVLMPLAEEVYAKETLENIRLFNSEARSIVEGSGGVFADLTFEIPSRHFLTRSHLNRQGHIITGSLMTEIILNELQ
ncbi:MAG: hypothetical protein KAR83_03760 [Thermodesulfovibrionales bacterium]|nr:hypothetical protein [Thermodesulfovibrionales bacterium]